MWRWGCRDWEKESGWEVKREATVAAAALPVVVKDDQSERRGPGKLKQT